MERATNEQIAAQPVAAAAAPGRLRARAKRWLWLAPVALVLLVAPQFASGYPVYILNLVLIYIIVSLGLNLLTGYAGQISIGHAGFFAIGAYTTAILVTKAGVPFWIALACGGVLTSGIGALVGIPALRLSGLYLAMATLGFGTLIQQIALRWESLTNGPHGIYVGKPALGPLVLDSDHRFYYLALAASVMFLLATMNIVRSKLGRAFIAIRDNERAAEAMGVSLVRYKTIAFTLSAWYTGIAGGLFASLLGYINVENFSFLLSIFFFTIIVIGGFGSILGSVLGAVFLTLIPELFRGLQDQQELLFGLMIILAMRFARRGLADLWPVVARWGRAIPFWGKGQGAQVG